MTKKKSSTKAEHETEEAVPVPELPPDIPPAFMPGFVEGRDPVPEEIRLPVEVKADPPKDEGNEVRCAVCGNKAKVGLRCPVDGFTNSPSKQAEV